MALLVTDRCDRCMAQAVASADYWTWATPLLFCGHHRAGIKADMLSKFFGAFR